MDFELSPEHEMIRRTARDFAEKEIRPVAAHVDKTGEFPKATIAKMAGLGFLGMTIPEEYDGAGLDSLAWRLPWGGWPAYAGPTGSSWRPNTSSSPGTFGW